MVELAVQRRAVTSVFLAMVESKCWGGSCDATMLPGARPRGQVVVMLCAASE